MYHMVGCSIFPISWTSFAIDKRLRTNWRDYPLFAMNAIDMLLGTTGYKRQDILKFMPTVLLATGIVSRNVALLAVNCIYTLQKLRDTITK